MTKKFIEEFNQNRTPFFISSFFILIESIIPGLAIWILIGFDFSISMNSNLPNPKGLYIFLICLSYFVYTFLITYFFYLIKLHKSDNFIFSLTLSSIFILIIAIGSFLENNTWMIIVKFLIVLLAIVLLIPLYVFISILFRNQEIKKQDDLEKMYQAYKENKIIPTKELLKAQRYEKYLLNKIKQNEDLEKFRIELEEKLQIQLQEQENEEKLKLEKLNQKLDKKELKSKNKKNKNKK